MIRFYFTLLFTTAFVATASAQSKPDTTKQLKDVTVKGYLSEQPMLSVPASVSVITPAQLHLQPENSLVPVMNTIPGVRMEERSPGSYRLSIRGSLLRSPFGVRDVKVYYDEIPLTDAGGNTYLNSLDFNSVQGVEVLKGPDGSLFGANSGGVVLISPVNRFSSADYVKLGFNGGSYSLLHQNLSLQKTERNHQFNIAQSYQSYGGYREHSNMERKYIQASDRITYGTNNHLKILGLYSDLAYQTPGGLTAAQLALNPRSARPSGALPGAIAQDIRITTKLALGGLVNEWHITDHIRNVASVYGSYANFSNPFITNYEQRYEGTYGLRTYFEFTGDSKPNFDWKANVGVEWQKTDADINNYDNNKGTRGNPQALSKVNTDQHFIFARYQAELFGKLHAEIAGSINFYQYDFKDIFPTAQADFTNRNFKSQFMPRVALSYQITNDFVWRASVSRGYSTPTTAEIRATDNVINTALQPQYGWNYETGGRFRTSDGNFMVDASVFYYHLKDAIVSRTNANQTTTFFNAGETKQLGFEAALNWWVMPQTTEGFIRGVQLNAAYTLSKFKFGNYVSSANFNGNQLTGVPQQVVVPSVQVKLPKMVYLFVQYNNTSRIPLNDANTVYSESYYLLQAKSGWQVNLSPKTKLEIYAGADNILNRAYSLGNDLNAPGNRYFNPSAPRNYYGGFNVIF